MNYKSVKNTPKACTDPVRIKENLWLFLTIREIFFKKLCIKNAIYPCLGISSKINVYRRAAVVLTTLGVSIKAADSLKKTAAKK